MMEVSIVEWHNICLSYPESAGSTTFKLDKLELGQQAKIARFYEKRCRKAKIGLILLRLPDPKMAGVGTYAYGYVRMLNRFGASCHWLVPSLSSFSLPFSVLRFVSLAYIYRKSFLICFLPLHVSPGCTISPSLLKPRLLTIDSISIPLG
jgi:hypothetical protein